jgi:hypothetical protein
MWLEAEFFKELSSEGDEGAFQALHWALFGNAAN